uniref:hypothetical protein n=1 Tax=Lacticaseibacillus paracasei TaxID=1597 RepID=UPI00404684C7
FAHAITTDAWRNSLDHYQEFVIIVALDLKIEVLRLARSQAKTGKSSLLWLEVSKRVSTSPKRQLKQIIN